MHFDEREFKNYADRITSQTWRLVWGLFIFSILAAIVGVGVLLLK